MDDLTLLYYTANFIKPTFAANVRAHLMETTGGDWPLISVSHEPIAFGHNICVGSIGRSAYNIYRQIALGAAHVHTKYVACCEDDCLYTLQHFATRPTPGHFNYNLSRLWLEEPCFRYRRRTGMFTCIVEADVLRAELATRHQHFPTAPESMRWYGEPGRCNAHLRLPPVPYEYVDTTDAPPVTFNHRTSLGGKRRTDDQDVTFTDHPYWGNAGELWRRIYG